MDKNTLSNYGWIVIAVLVLAVMIALATPFGNYVKTATESTLTGLFDTSESALNVVGMSAKGDGSSSSGTQTPTEPDAPTDPEPTECQHTNTTIINASATYAGDTYCNDCNTTIATGEMIPAPVLGNATFDAKTTEGCDCLEEDADGFHYCFVSIEPVILTWDELKLAENGTQYGYDASKITDTSIGDWAFNGCNSLKSITIPNSVTSIGKHTFSWCDSLTSIGPIGSGASVEIPDSITSIEQYAFESCFFLTAITIPDNVTIIDECAFTHCIALTSITIPESVTTIGASAFFSCTSLTSVNLSESVATIGRNAFDYCTSLTSVKFENTNGWTAGTTALSAEDLANTSTAATYLKYTYCNRIWTRS